MSGRLQIKAFNLTQDIKVNHGTCCKYSAILHFLSFMTLCVIIIVNRSPSTNSALVWAETNVSKWTFADIVDTSL